MDSSETTDSDTDTEIYDKVGYSETPFTKPGYTK